MKEGLMRMPAAALCSAAERGTALAETVNKVSMEGCSLHMEKLLNARQLGGYAAMDGRTVRDGVLLRSAKLVDASENDLARLKDEFGLRTIVDFRTPGEEAAGPNPVLEGVQDIKIQVIDENSTIGEVAKNIPGATVNIDATIKGMLELIRGEYVNDRLYIEQIDTDAGKAGYRAFFDVLLESDGAVLWHCTSGKDRTGVASVLALEVLGVDKETALQDFALSNEFHTRNVNYICGEAKRFTDDSKELEAMMALAGVSRVYMEKLFEFAEEKHGSLLNYIRQEMGVTDEEIDILRAKYLV